MAVGTPHYMSPEQSLGGDMDGRSDEYSLGCVLYELLVGQPPFDGPNAMAVLARHSLEQVPSMQVVRNSIPDAVEDATFRALEKTPADRYPSMKEFAEALGEAEAEASLLRTSVAPRQHARARRSRYRSRPGAPRPGSCAPAARGTPRRLEFEAVEEPEPRRTWLIVGAVVAVARRGRHRRAAVHGRTGAASRWPPWPRETMPAASPCSTSRPRAPAIPFASSPTASPRDSSPSSAQVGELDVISSNGVAPFRGGSVPRDSIARALKVGTLVEGSVEQEKDRVRVTVRLVDAASGAEFQRASFEQPASQYLTLGDSLAQKAAVFLRERLGAEVRLREQRQRASNPAGLDTGAARRGAAAGRPTP